MTKTLYVATAEPYHDNSTLIGVFETLEAAKAAIRAALPSIEWKENGEGAWNAQIPERNSHAFAANPLYAWWMDYRLTEAFDIVRVDVGRILVAPPENP